MRDFSRPTKNIDSRSRSFSDLGIVLTRKNYGEGDRILILFTKAHGRVPLIAKGVRKIKSRKRGHIEVFSLIKFHAAYGNGLDILTEAEIVNDFSAVRSDLKRVTVAYFFTEVIGKITRDNVAHEELFYLLRDYLNKLCNSNSLKLLRDEFTQEALVSVGFWPMGQKMTNPDLVLETVVEKKINSIRVGKKILSKR